MIVVDRIEGGAVICISGGVLIEISVSDIDGDVREGDVLQTCDNGGRYSVDTEATVKRRQNISERFNRLKNKNLFS